MDIIKEIVKRLKTIEPQKIILFGSYAYGKPNENSDFDIFIVKDIKNEQKRDLEIEAKLKLIDLIMNYHLSFDIFIDSEKSIKNRIDKIKDSFYKEIFEKGKIIYAK